MATRLSFKPAPAVPRRVGIFGVLLLAALPVFFLALGANSIWDANEAFYVDTPRHMVESGDYITPMFNGEERLNKPVLSYWVVSGLYRVAGVSVTIERVGIALGLLAVIASAFLIGRAILAPRVGALAALIVATSPRVVMWSRRIAIDTFVTAFMSLALACCVLAERHPESRTRYLLGMYACIGLGVLTKGPVALLLPLAAYGAWLILEGRWREIFRWQHVAGIALVIAIVAPWYVALVVRHGWGPVTGFLVGENLDRFTTLMQPDPRPFWFYGPVLLSDLFPWAPLCVVPLALAWRRRAGGGPAALRRLLGVWVVVIVGAFSLSQSKQDLYIYPVIAAVAVLIAEWIAGSVREHFTPAIEVIVAVVGAVVAACGLGVWRLFGSGYYTLDGSAPAAVILVAGGVSVLLAAGLRRPHRAVALLATTFIAFNYVFVVRLLPSVERLKPVVPLAETFLRRAGPAGRLGSYEMMLPSLVYYANQPVVSLESLEQAKAFYTSGPGAWAIMDQGRFDELHTEVPGVCVAARRPRLDPRFEDVWAGRPPADVLLVTNQCERPTN